MAGEPAVAGRKSHSKSRKSPSKSRGCEFQKVEGLERLETLAGEFRKPSSLSSLSRLFEKKVAGVECKMLGFAKLAGVSSLSSLSTFLKRHAKLEFSGVQRVRPWLNLLDRVKFRREKISLRVRPRSPNMRQKWPKFGFGEIWSSTPKITRQHPTFWLGEIGDLELCPGSSNSYTLGYLKRGRKRVRL